MSRRLLWTDDDGADWFVYEASMLSRAGWEIHWARDVTSAVERLSAEPFDALIIDQMLPWRTGEVPTAETIQIWGGCTILWWLRQQRCPEAVPFPTRIRELAFWNQQPHPGNRAVPAIFVSAFYDEQVEQVTRSASRADASLEILAKPVRLGDLEHFLAAVPERR